MNIFKHNLNKMSEKRPKTIFLVILVCAVALVSIFPTIKVGATQEEGQQQSQNPQSGDKSVYCKSLLGWLICPLMEISASAADSVYNMIEGFLVLDPTVISGPAQDDSAPSTESAPANPAKDAWEIFRDIANILMVIVLLIVIASYVTGFGINDYNIKKMLPKIIVAVVLINLSFYVVQIAIDLSNIIGAGIKGLFDNMSEPIINQGGVKPTWGGNIATFIVGGLLAFTAAKFTPLMSFIFPIVVAIVVTSLLILLLLMARQAIAILILVLSPVAFASMILPNTEKLFNTWKSGLFAVITTYPIVALLFSGGKLAGNIIISGAKDDYMIMIIGALLRVIPMFLAPSMIQSSVASLPLVGKTASKWFNGIKGWSTKKAKGSALVAGSRDRHQKRTDTRIAKRKPWTQGGRMRQQEALTRQEREISAMSQSFNDADIELFKKYSQNTKTEKDLLSELSDSGRRAYLSNNKDTGKALLAAGERLSQEGDANPDDYSRLMRKAKAKGMSDEQLRKTNRRAYANSRTANNISMESRLENTVRHNSSTMMLADGGFIASKSAADFGRASADSLEQMKGSIQSELSGPNGANTRAVLEKAIVDSSSTSPATAAKLREIIGP